jgi:hypothetical protein
MRILSLLLLTIFLGKAVKAKQQDLESAVIDTPQILEGFTKR